MAISSEAFPDDMKKKFPALLALAIFAGSALVAADRPTVALLLKVRNAEGFWGQVEQGAQEAANAANVNLIVRGTTNVSNSEAQLKLLESLVGLKIDALVITPANPALAVGPLQSHAARGLKIVVAESDLGGDTPFPFVGYDQTKLASTAATAFAALLNKDDDVALFRSVSDQVVVQRDKVIVARLKELQPELRLYLDFFAVSNEHSSVGEKAVLLVQKYPAAKLFIGTSTPSTLALLNAAKSAGAGNKIKIAGFGFQLTHQITDAIENGTIPTFVCQVPRELGYKSVAAAAALLRGETVPARTDVAFFIVTKANLQTPEIQALRVP